MSGTEIDLEALHGYVKDNRSAEQADALLDHLLAAIETLETFPLRGSVPKELDALGIREFRQILVEPYRLIYRVGGKTGSANKLVNGRYDASHGVGSFASVFPADGPDDARRYVVFVLVDEPSQGSRLGGAVAAPVVGRVIDRIAGFLGVQRRIDPPVVAEPAA
ncbi:MAG: hypothetical protein B7Z42_09785 [Brevundimonas sp. 12-68-7]|nr:MAG: hypothetical protein B7Z42_09785 [Brevundimonas sp. 12-68-7]